MAYPQFDRIRSLLLGSGLKAKAMRSTFWSAIGVFGTNGLRLLSNIVLTRLLFPEAFGLMALVQVFIVALQTFSDLGINTAIIQSKRGDDPTFLNTAWTMQIMRGFVLWLGAFALAWPAAQIYEQPELLWLLPATALAVVIQSFRPTRVAQANRHLTLGRLTLINLSVQLITLTLTALLAWWWRSVWALVASQLISTLLGNILTRIFIPGQPNRLQWDRESLQEIFAFGKFIFFATIATFLVTTGDRAIIGGYVDVTTFGIYSVALAFGTLPYMIGQTLNGQVLFPLTRALSPTESDESRRKIFRARRIISVCLTAIAVLLAFTGPWLIDVLYDARYSLAKPMVVLFALNTIPSAATIGAGSVLLAQGNSRSHFYLMASIAVTQTALLFVLLHFLGIAGGILASGIALILTYPILAIFIRRYRGWDPVGDALTITFGYGFMAIACALHWDEIMKLFP